MLNITSELAKPEEGSDKTTPKRVSLKQYLLEKLRTWVNSLLEGERDEFLGRGRHPPLDAGHQNYRNGYRPRRINFFGLGEVELQDRATARESSNPSGCRRGRDKIRNWKLS